MFRVTTGVMSHTFSEKDLVYQKDSREACHGNPLNSLKIEEFPEFYEFNLINVLNPIISKVFFSVFGVCWRDSV